MSVLFLILSAGLPTLQELADWQRIQRADNTTVEWSLSIIGLLPYIEPELVQACDRQVGKDWFRQEMVRKLRRRDSFAFAHVALSHVAPGLRDGTDLPGWFGLEVEFDNNGGTSFPNVQRQMRTLAEYWRQESNVDATPEVAGVSPRSHPPCVTTGANICGAPVFRHDDQQCSRS